ncbi:MAG: DUF1801 domain-containing protein [Gemmatimonadaceae bacterium]|nr:DUF1801 domain-containing protein [Chitinophagaceae bacterium]
MKSKKTGETTSNDTAAVDLLMSGLVHPFKSEIELVREIIKKSNKKIREQVKWNAPSFFYLRDMAAFNLRQEKFIQLIFVFHDGAMIHESDGLLEGVWKDRREARFYDMADIKKKKASLEKVVNEWLGFMEKSEH